MTSLPREETAHDSPQREAPIRALHFDETRIARCKLTVPRSKLEIAEYCGGRRMLNKARVNWISF